MSRERWDHANLKKFNKVKCKVLHLGGDNLQYEYRLGDEGVESSPIEQDMEILGDEKLDVSHQRVLAAQKASCILGCIKRHVVCNTAFSFRVPNKRRTWTCLSKSRRRLWRRPSMKMVRGLEHLPYENRLRGLVVFSMERRRLQRDLIVAFQYLKRGF